VCSSPQLIAAYHVLLRLLEPRHPPCALICFKTIQIFKSLTSLKVTRYYNFFSQYVKELFLVSKDSLMSWIRSTRPQSLLRQHHSFQKNFHNATALFSLRIAGDPALPSCASGRFATLLFSPSPHQSQLTRSASGRKRPSTGLMICNRLRLLWMVEDIGVEPMTPCLQSRCSSQLS
jgi:hypothetical protein